jgi:hypothetical protein
LETTERFPQLPQGTILQSDPQIKWYRATRLAGPVPTQMRGRPGRSRPSLPPSLLSSGGPAGTKRRPIQTRTSAQVPADGRLRARSACARTVARRSPVITRAIFEGADGQPPMGPLHRPRFRAARRRRTATRKGERGTLRRLAANGAMGGGDAEGSGWSQVISSTAEGIDAHRSGPLS